MQADDTTPMCQNQVWANSLFAILVHMVCQRVREILAHCEGGVEFDHQCVDSETHLSSTLPLPKLVLRRSAQSWCRTEPAACGAYHPEEVAEVLQLGVCDAAYRAENNEAVKFGSKLIRKSMVVNSAD